MFNFEQMKTILMVRLKLIAQLLRKNLHTMKTNIKNLSKGPRKPQKITDWFIFNFPVLLYKIRNQNIQQFIIAAEESGKSIQQSTWEHYFVPFVKMR